MVLNSEHSLSYYISQDGVLNIVTVAGIIGVLSVCNRSSALHISKFSNNLCIFLTDSQESDSYHI